jgi:hypothetical protein
MQTYSLDKIKDHWDDYQAANCWRALRGGKWTIYTKQPDLSDAVSCQMVKVRTVMSFPRYLEVFDA